MNRNTKQRELILSIVNHSYLHPNAYDIYELCKERLPNIILGTVYRNLNSLVEDGCISVVSIDDNTLRYDIVLDKHAHFMCIECGCILDVYHTYFDDKFHLDGNLVMDCEINFKGICSKCLQKEE